MNLDKTAVFALIVGAVCAEVLTLYFIRHNRYFSMQLLFGAWVLAPFAVLAIARLLSPHWTGLSRSTLNLLTILIAAFTTAVFAYANSRGPRAQAAFPFIALPPLSVLVILLAGIVSTVTSRR